MPQDSQDSFHWPEFSELSRVALQVVEKTRRQLPAEIRVPAAEVPVTVTPVPDPALQADGLAPDLLGLFVGNDRSAGAEGVAPLPPQILLFLDNLWDFADGDWDVFRDEVRTTYLHELGHYLGWDEDAIEARGLG